MLCKKRYGLAALTLPQYRLSPVSRRQVETVREPIEGLSFLAHRVVSASPVLPLAGHGLHSFQFVRIAPSLVQLAMREAESAELQST